MALIKAGPGAFTDLKDTPSSYTGSGLQGVRVNVGASALEFYTIVGTDEKAKVSSNDTTAGYLNGKLVAGTNITLTELNDGLNETLSIAAVVPAESDPLSLHLDQTVQQTIINNGILVAPDTDVASTLGRWKLGYVGDPLWVDYPIFAHYDAFNTTDFALCQDPGGWTYINCAAISNIDFCVGGIPFIRLNGGGFSVEAQPILFGTVGSEDIEIKRLGVQNLGLYSDYGDVDIDIIGSLSATSTITGKLIPTTAGSDPQDVMPASRPAGVLYQIIAYSGKLYFCTNAGIPLWEKIASA